MNFISSFFFDSSNKGSVFYLKAVLGRWIYYETVIVIADEVVGVNKENKTYASEEKLGDVVAVRSYKDSDKYEINYTFLNKIAK